MRVLVTGANGKLGRGVVADLLGHDIDVVATDALGRAGHLSDLGVPLVHADLTDLGAAMDVVAGTDAVVHLANIPAPGMETPASTFTRNTTMNFHVFHAASLLGVRRVVWASSETTLGLPFETPPRYVPIDEAHYPLPTSTYGLSKVVTETMAAEMSAWTSVPFVALRFSNIMARRGLRRLPVVPGRCAAAKLEPVELHRSSGRGRGLPPGALRAGHGCPELHHRERRHRHGTAHGGAPPRGLPGRPGAG